MSADLLAEFGTGVTSAAPEKKLHRLQHRTFPDIDLSEPSADSSHSKATTSQPKQPGPLRIACNTEDATDDLWHRDDQGADVLFDASTENIHAGDDEEWGEFESAESGTDKDLLDIEVESTSPAMSRNLKNSPQPIDTSRTSAVLNLLSLDDGVSSQNEKSTPYTVLEQRPKQASSSASSNKAPIIQEQNDLSEPSREDSLDDWGEFIDGSEDSPQPESKGQHDRQANVRKLSSLNVTRLDQANQPGTSTIEKSPQPDVRPTNIPPPYVLLQLFPSVLEEFRERGMHARRDPSISQGLASRLTCTLKVAARVITGRTLRWKRDTILSQSTKIGPARSGKISGMKLSSVSKGESIKEEQEAVGIIEIWRRHSAVFNAVILSSGGRPVPVISDKSRIETASADQGALRASHACAICGLKRDERLPKIDENVEDSFGDWWIEHWGHTECKNFWNEYSRDLHQR